MISPVTDLSRARLKFLLDSSWPTTPGGIEDFVSRTSGQRTTVGDRSEITPVSFTVHEDRLLRLYWFAHYPDSTELVYAFISLCAFVDATLGTVSLTAPDDLYSAYWRTTGLAVEIYAHDAAPLTPSRQLVPTLQVSVSDILVADAKEALDRVRFE